MKFGPSNNSNNRNRIKPLASSLSPSALLPKLPPSALAWSTAASTAAAISYADRSTSAIAASSLLEELHWTEGQLGDVQSAFFVGYALTQVLGGLLGGAVEPVNDGGGNDTSAATATANKSGGYRTVLPWSLFLTGVTTFLFPLAASCGPSWASLDRFCLGLLEGVLLPAAMAGVSATTTATVASGDVESPLIAETSQSSEEGNNNKATASALVIAGCYLGSAWAYLSAWLLFSERFQLQLAEWGYEGSIWPCVFYVNGILSMVLLVFFREEFNIFGSLGANPTKQSAQPKDGEIGYSSQEMDEAMTRSNNVWTDTVSIAKETISTKSGRAIIAAQISQGALLYSIASYAPLYLERINAVALPSESMHNTATSASISSVAVAASVAASSLILPQISQALVGIGIGAAADQMSSKIGTSFTRRALQIISGVAPALVLWYLAGIGSGEVTSKISPEFLFGAAQTASALSLGAVSVSHLDIATPAKAGAVYALGNVAASASGSLIVNLFGRLLEDGGSTGANVGAEFALPFRIVAVLSATGAIIYRSTVGTELEIGFNQTAPKDD